MLKLDVSVSRSWQVPWDWALVSSSQFIQPFSLSCAHLSFEPCQLFQPPIPIHIIHKSYGFNLTAYDSLLLSSNSIIQRSCPNAPNDSHGEKSCSLALSIAGFIHGISGSWDSVWFCPTGTTCIRWSPRCIGPVWPIAVFGVCPGRDASFNWCRKIGRPSNLAHLTKAWRWPQLGALVLNIFSRVASMNLFIG